MELKRNILDIKGIRVGQAENPTAKTGVSVVLAETGAICGVDVRGAGPGTRETDLLNPSIPWRRCMPLCFRAALPSAWRRQAVS